MGVGDVLQRFQALDVLLKVLPAGARTRAGDGIGRFHQDCFNRNLVHFVVVSGDGVADSRADAVAFGKFRADLGVRAFSVVVHGFAEIVQQGANLGDFHIRAEFSRKHAGNLGCFHGMGKLVLTIRGAIF